MAGFLQDNRGLKLLKLMGYRDGDGLGKEKEGVGRPAEVDLDQQRQGLGYLEVKRCAIYIAISYGRIQRNVSDMAAADLPGCRLEEAKVRDQAGVFFVGRYEKRGIYI